MDWSLRACARHGHEIYRPNEDELAQGLRSATPVGEAWKCLRCGAFIPGEPFAYGPADAAPHVLHDRQIRDRAIIRFLAVERAARGVIVLILAWAVWQIRGSQETLEQHLNKDIPLLKPFADQFGWDLQNSHAIHLLNSVVETSPRTLSLIALALFAYGVLQSVEGVGLWQQRRWAEYLTVVATSAFIPFEIYELMHKVTIIRAGALVINVAAVVWLLWSKHLFGLNGGAAAAHDEAVMGRGAIEYALAMTTTVPAP